VKTVEKITISALIIGLTAAFTLFGVNEDKVWFFAPVTVLTYLAVLSWVAGILWRRAGRRQVPGQPMESSVIRPPASDLRIPPGGIPLLLFCLYSFALIPFSPLPYEAKISSLVLGGYVAVYWASANILSRFSVRKTVWASVFIMLVITALYSLVQHKVAPDYIFGMERYTGYWEYGRLGGTYQCPNHIAHLFQMWLPLCLVFLFIPQFGWFWRICFAYALPLFLLLIYQTQSRAGLLGAVAALSITVLFMILRKSRRAFFVALLVVPLLGAAAVGGLWTASSMFRTRMQPVVQLVKLVAAGKSIDEHFNDFRPLTWIDTVVMIKERPVFGFGPGNYSLMFEDYRTRFTGVRIETIHPHNEYLELLSEYGLIGGVLVLWVLVSLTVQMIRFIRTTDRPYHALPAAALLGTLAGTAVHGLFDFELHNLPNAMMLALLAGCAAAPLVRTSADKEVPITTTQPPASRRSPLSGLGAVFRLLFSVLLLLSALWPIQVMSSAWIRVWGDKFQQEQKFQQAERFYKTAEKIDPQNWMAPLGLGQVYYTRRYYELDPVRKREWAVKEQAAYSAAYQTNPKKEEVVYGLARIELFLGQREAGLAYLRQVAHYKRFNDFYWRKLGIELRKAGLYDEALSAFEYAQKLARSNPTVKRNIKWLKNREFESKGQKPAAK
jgi:O-antigen ligase